MSLISVLGVQISHRGVGSHYKVPIMKKHVLLFLLIMSSSLCPVFAQHYDAWWKEVHTAVDNDLPRTAQSLLHSIERQAHHDRNAAQLLATLLTSCQLAAELSPDSLEQELQRFEALANAEKRPVQRLLWQAAMAKLWMRNWADADKVEAGKDMMLAVLNHAEMLHAAAAADHLPLFVLGPTSWHFANDLLHVFLLDFLNQGALTTAQSQALTARFEQFYRERGFHGAALWLALRHADATMLAEQYAGASLAVEAVIRRVLSMPTSTNAERSEAVRVANEGLCQYANHPRAAVLRNFLHGLQQPTVNIQQIHELIYPGEEQAFEVSATHVRRLQWLCYEGSDTCGAPICVSEVRFPDCAPWWRCDTLLHATFPAPGRYTCVVRADGQVLTTHTVNASRLRPLCWSVPNRPMRVVAVDARSGAPVSPFSVVALDAHDVPIATYAPDADGFVRLSAPVRGSRKYAVVTPSDSLSPTFRYYPNSRPSSSAPDTCLAVFTDRVLYRPAQQVRLGGISYVRMADSLRVLPNRVIPIMVRDVQGKVIFTDSLVANENGDFNAHFALPADIRPGYCSILDHQGRHWASFRVEEYQRPAFHVSLQVPSQTYCMGDSLQLRGNATALTDVPIAGATVRYRIFAASYWRTSADRAPLATGEVLTAPDGGFLIPWLIPSTPLEGAMDAWRTRRYRVEVDVVDHSGQQQSSELGIVVNRRPTVLSIEVPSVVMRESLPKVLIARRNAMGVVQAGKVSFTLQQAGRTVFEGQAPSGQPFTPDAWEKLPDGAYQLCAVASDADTVRTTLTLFGATSHRPPVATPFFYYVHPSDVVDSAVVYLGTTEHNATLFYDEISENGEHLCHRRILLSDTLMQFRLAYDSHHGRGFTAHFSMLRNGMLYSESQAVVRPPEATQLKMLWHSFRNRVKPSNHETWQLQVLNPDSSVAHASLMATLYDAALDVLAPHRWDAPQPWMNSLPRISVTSTYAPRVALFSALSIEREPEPPLQFTTWDERWFNYAAPCRLSLRGQKTTAMGAMAKSAVVEEDMVLDAAPAMAVANQQASVDAAPEVALRSDFSETAYFVVGQPTDAQGLVTLQFTLPESVTTWRFMALAHDAQMRSALLTDQVVATRPLMLQAQPPRFAYEGDEVCIPLTITNLSDSVCQGTVHAQFRNVADSSLIAESQQSFLRKPGERQVSQVRIRVPEGVRSLHCEFKAVTALCSDGEAHVLPIHSQRMEVVNNLPFSFQATGDHRIEMTSLWPSTGAVADAQIQVRLTPSALHEALRALYYLADATPTSADERAHIYYATTLALWMADNYPYEVDSVRQKFQCQRAEMLEWLQCALQPEGGWAWFEGMEPSPVITTEIALLLARLQCRVGDASSRDLLAAVLPYLQQWVAQRVQQLREWESRHGAVLPPDEALLRYLQLHALLQLPQNADVVYLLEKSATLGKELSLYGRAVMSAICHYAGRAQQAEWHLQSLREHAVESPEMGVYFDSYRAQRLPQTYCLTTQVAALEAFAAVGDATMVKGMQQWLLQSKRTQAWTTSRVTADIVFALLSYAPQLPTQRELSQPQPITYHFYAADRLLQPAEVAQSATLPTACVFHKPAEGLAWGNIAATFTLPMSEVEAQATDLHVEQTIETEVQGKWVQLCEGESLSVGQRVRRKLMVVAQRDFDFVRLDAPRAATFQPAQPLSGVAAEGGLWTYRAVHDAKTTWYVEKMPKGKYTLTELLHVERTGQYSMCVPQIACTYAPEFAGRGASCTLHVQ